MKHTTLWLAALLVMSVLGSAHAAIIVTQDGVPAAFAGWDRLAPTANGITTNINGSGVLVGGNSEAAKIQADTAGMGPQWDTWYTTAAGLIGPINTDSARAMSLDFYTSSSRAAGNLRLYLSVDGQDVNTWYYDIGSLPAGWSSLSMINFMSGGNPSVPGEWYRADLGGDYTDFITDRGGFTMLGFELTYRSDTDGQIYGFDNLNLYDQYFVPEPQTYVVLGFALLSLGVVFRRQFHTLVGAKAVASR